MQYIRGIENFQCEHPTAITLGKFDGLHRGHQILIERVQKHQADDGVFGVVFAFDMSPLYLKQNKEPDFLLNSEEKARLLEGKVDYFVDCPFEESISGMSAEDFIKDVLVERFHARYIIVGTDFLFGYQKKGDYTFLQAYENIYGYQVEVMEKKMHQGREISSTYIKEELKNGNMDTVNLLLGYEYGK